MLIDNERDEENESENEQKKRIEEIKRKNMEEEKKQRAERSLKGIDFKQNLISLVRENIKENLSNYIRNK